MKFQEGEGRVRHSWIRVSGAVRRSRSPGSQRDPWFRSNDDSRAVRLRLRPLWLACEAGWNVGGWLSVRVKELDGETK